MLNIVKHIEDDFKDTLIGERYDNIDNINYVTTNIRLIVKDDNNKHYVLNLITQMKIKCKDNITVKGIVNADLKIISLIENNNITDDYKFENGLEKPYFLSDDEAEMILSNELFNYNDIKYKREYFYDYISLMTGKTICYALRNLDFNIIVEVLDEYNSHVNIVKKYMLDVIS